MTIKQLQARVEALEAEVKRLREHVAATPPKQSVLELFGKYADDPTFDEADRTWREIREKKRKKDLAAFDRREKAERKKAAAKKRGAANASA